MKRMLREWNKENGQAIVAFTLVFIALMFFVGITVDLNMLYHQRNAMETTCQMIRDNRFTFQDSVRYADNPGETMYRVVSDSLAANGYGDETSVNVYFCEDTPQPHYRFYRVRVELIQAFHWNFLKIFGADTSNITVRLDGGEAYGDGALEMVWCPEQPPSAYNGCYSGKPGSACTSFTGDLPEDW